MILNSSFLIAFGRWWSVLFEFESAPFQKNRKREKRIERKNSGEWQYFIQDLKYDFVNESIDKKVN